MSASVPAPEIERRCGSGAHQGVCALAGEYQNLQNRLRFLAGGDGEKVNELFERLQGLA